MRENTVNLNKVSTQRLDHLGIVAGVCHEIDLAERIDSKVDKETDMLTVGQAVMAMVLNALGFVGRPGISSGYTKK